MPVIDVNVFDYASVSRAARRLDEYAADLVEKANELCRRLAEIGKVRAELDFSNAIYDGTNDVTVHVEPIDNGYAVRATGGAVMFIEFGAGVYHNGQGAYPGELPPGVVGIGQYGQGRGKNDWWLYPGPPGNAGGVPSTTVPGMTITHGNPPAAAMYNAQQEVTREIQRIADEVFAR